MPSLYLVLSGISKYTLNYEALLDYLPFLHKESVSPPP